MKKTTVTRSTETKKIRELQALLDHANELIRSLSRQADEATRMAVTGYFQRRNDLFKQER